MPPQTAAIRAPRLRAILDVWEYIPFAPGMIGSNRYGKAVDPNHGGFIAPEGEKGVVGNGGLLAFLFAPDCNRARKPEVSH